jgi:hypothetical protein
MVRACKWESLIHHADGMILGSNIVANIKLCHKPGDEGETYDSGVLATTSTCNEQLAKLKGALVLDVAGVSTGF